MPGRKRLLSPGRFLFINLNKIYDDISHNINGIGFQFRCIHPPELRTDISKDLAIIDQKDKISDILCNIVSKLNCNSIKFYVATGYVFESGLDLLEPIYQLLIWRSMAGMGLSIAELVVGALQKYDGINKIKELNYATAKKMNFMLENQIFLIQKDLC